MIYRKSNQSGFISTKVSMIAGSILAVTAVGASAFIGVNASTLDSAAESASDVCIEAWWADNEDIYAKRCSSTPGSGVIKPPTEEEPPVIVDPDTEITTLIYRCDSEETGELHFSEVADDAIITINGGEYNNQIIEFEYDEVKFAPGVVYEASLEGEFVELSGHKKAGGVVSSLPITPFGVKQVSLNTMRPNEYAGMTNCLREIKTISEDSGVKLISHLGGNLEKVPNRIPTTVDKLNDTFNENAKFNDPNIVSWDVSNVKELDGTFSKATSFNQPIGEWRTEKLNYLSNTFYGASSFNQPLNNWDVSKVYSFNNTFYGASNFNQPLNNWDVSEGIYFIGTFYSAASFSQDISMWDLSRPDEYYYFERFNDDSRLTPEQLPKFASS